MGRVSDPLTSATWTRNGSESLCRVALTCRQWVVGILEVPASPGATTLARRRKAVHSAVISRASTRLPDRRVRSGSPSCLRG